MYAHCIHLIIQCSCTCLTCAMQSIDVSEALTVFDSQAHCVTQDYDKNVLKCCNDYRQLFAEFEDLLCKHTKHSRVHVMHAKGPLSAAEQKDVSQGMAVLVLPCRTPKPLGHLRASLEKAKPAQSGLVSG